MLRSMVLPVLANDVLAKLWRTSFPVPFTRPSMQTFTLLRNYLRVATIPVFSRLQTSIYFLMCVLVLALVADGATIFSATQWGSGHWVFGFNSVFAVIASLVILNDAISLNMVMLDDVQWVICMSTHGSLSWNEFEFIYCICCWLAVI